MGIESTCASTPQDRAEEVLEQAAKTMSARQFEKALQNEDSPLHRKLAALGYTHHTQETSNHGGTRAYERTSYTFYGADDPVRASIFDRKESLKVLAELDPKFPVSGIQTFGHSAPDLYALKSLYLAANPNPSYLGQALINAQIDAAEHGYPASKDKCISIDTIEPVDIANL